MKASIIIPAYNAAGFIEAAVRSIIQTPPPFEYEVLVVDDGSTDATPALLEKLEEEAPPLRVIRQENAGPAAARNRGIAEARGEYVLFCDSDDVFVPNAIQQAVTLCENKEADILIFGFTLVQKGERADYSYPETHLFTPAGLGAQLAPLYRANMLNQVWGKVFSRELLIREKLAFPAEMWGEDRLFFFSALEKARRIFVSPLCLYDYIQQEGSLISRFLREKPEVCRQIHNRIRALAHRLGSLDKEGERVYSYMYCKSLLSAFSTLYSPSCPLTHREKRDYVKEVLSQPELREITSLPEDAGKSFAVLARILLTRNVTLNLMAAWGMNLASRLLPDLFRKAKHVYNNKGE